MSVSCLDFTDARYLGFVHPSHALGELDELTTGAPAALRESPLARAVARGFARLTGLEHGLVYPSSLHLAFDFFQRAVRPGELVLWDEGLYPVVREALQAVTCARDLHSLSFTHHDVADLRRVLRQCRPRRGMWIVCDGYCPDCGRAAPLDAYADLAAQQRGVLFVDDTQAVGVIGQACSRAEPWGVGGGGSARAQLLTRAPVLVAASLSKAFAAPVCVVAGEHALIAWLEQQSAVRVHLSPPSNANLCAAARALRLNQTFGDAARARLLAGTQYFVQRATRLGLHLSSGLHPVQRCFVGAANTTRRVHRELAHRGVLTVPQQARCGVGSSITFVLTTNHSPAAIDFALDTLATVLATTEPRGPRLVAQTCKELHHE